MQWYYQSIEIPHKSTCGVLWYPWSFHLMEVGLIRVYGTCQQSSLAVCTLSELYIALRQFIKFDTTQFASDYIVSRRLACSAQKIPDSSKVKRGRMDAESRSNSGGTDSLRITMAFISNDWRGRTTTPGGWLLLW